MKKNSIESSLLTSVNKKEICKQFLIVPLLVFCNNNLSAQNVSDNRNIIPIPTGNFNTGFGWQPLFSNNNGMENTATGYQTLFSNKDGNANVANGAYTLFQNRDGSSNVATGAYALYSNDDGNNNTANGDSALYSNVSGQNNSAFGKKTLFYNTNDYNTANGSYALYNNISGSQNVASGSYALYSNVGGSANTAVGYAALQTNDAFANTAIGTFALVINASGSYNCAHGTDALANNVSGNFNAGFGVGAMSGNYSGSNNSGFGSGSNVGLSNLINATAVGSGAIVNDSNKVRLGDANVTVVEGPVAYTISDGRFKNNISEKDVRGLDFIKLLRPVVYNFDTRKFQEFLTKNMPDSLRKGYLNKDFSKSTAIRQSGFIAQDVEKAAKESGYDFNGVHKPNHESDNYSLAYSQFVVPLVKGMQEQQEMIEHLQKQVEDQKQMISDLQNKSANSTGINQLNADQSFKMEQNVPNPFTHETLVKYTLPQGISTAYMAVYDLTGKQITTLPLGQTGASSISITSEKLAAGIYIYSIIADGKIMDSKRMVVAEK